jgi:hypothetical protein
MMTFAKFLANSNGVFHKVFIKFSDGTIHVASSVSKARQEKPCNN